MGLLFNNFGRAKEEVLTPFKFKRIEKVLSYKNEALKNERKVHE